MAEQFFNNYTSTLAAGIDASQTTFAVAAAPTGYVTGSTFRVQIENEIVKATDVTGTTVTCVRAQDGTTAATHAISTPVAAVLTRDAMLQAGLDAANPNIIATDLVLPANTSVNIAGGKLKVSSGTKLKVASGSTLRVGGSPSIQVKSIATNQMSGGVTALANRPLRLTAASASQQVFVGAGQDAQTVSLPDATTIRLPGWSYEIDNATSGSGSVSVYANDGTTLLATVGPAACAIFNLQRNSTSNGVWECDITAPNLAIRQMSVGQWTFWGHSYFMNGAGTYDSTGRADNLFRSQLGLAADDCLNRAVNGSRVTMDAVAGAQGYGGWWCVATNTQWRGTNTTAKVKPYTSSGGGHVICLGLNDIGNYGPSLQQMTAFLHAMRFCISRMRAATVKDNTDASVAYSGFTAVTGNVGKSTMGTLRNSTTVGNTFTITIPADYQGETIAICLMGQSGATGGAVGWTGTAGLTGGINTSNIKASGDGTTCPVVVRFVAPVTGSTQTIIGTVQNVDGTISFDTWWLESRNPPPVIVCNLSRLGATGSAYYATWNASSPTAAQRDADVLRWNTALQSMIQTEFDAMVQIADCDTAINGMDAYYSPNAPAGLHYNELGGARAAQAMVDAFNRLAAPAPSTNQLSCLAASPNINGAVKYPVVPGNYYHTQGARISAATYTCVAGDMFAVPFRVTQQGTRFTTIGFECTNAPTTGTTVRIASFQDDNGYPGTLVREHSAGVAVGTAAGFKSASITDYGEVDPGLYWIVYKINVAPTTVPTLRQIDGPVPDMPSLLTTGLPISGVLGPVAWKLTGQDANAFLPRFPSGATLVASAPYMGLLAAIPG